MNKHDRKRVEALIKTLRKAEEQADTAIVYLLANDRTVQDDLWNVELALQHIEIAIERLEGGEQREAQHEVQ